VVELLLNTGRVNPDSRDAHGRSPLSFAATKGHQRVAELLLATCKVEASSRSDGGYTPLRLAKENKHDAIFSLLLKSGKLDEDLTAPEPPKYVPTTLDIFSIVDDSAQEHGFKSTESETLRPEDYWNISGKRLELTISRSGWIGAMMYVHGSTERFAVVLGVHNWKPWSAIVSEFGKETLKSNEPLEDIMNSFYPSIRPGGDGLATRTDWVRGLDLASKPLLSGKMAKVEIISQESETTRKHSIRVFIE